mmetsp:Transcript_51569/g.137635  ORF Transcript_51569/g.137635 Transcript_51569/m.137635 type:complete len:201 (+) Transcript_51569:517-1119(+)
MRVLRPVVPMALGNSAPRSQGPRLQRARHAARVDVGPQCVVGDPCTQADLTHRLRNARTGQRSPQGAYRRAPDTVPSRPERSRSLVRGRWCPGRVVGKQEVALCKRSPVLPRLERPQTEAREPLLLHAERRPLLLLEQRRLQQELALHGLLGQPLQLREDAPDQCGYLLAQARRGPPWGPRCRTVGVWRALSKKGLVAER